ncbi:MAG: GNAT family N-acetyltransferase [Bacteroidota bacterium]
MILTERLALRPVQPVDIVALHAHWTDPVVRRYLWDDVAIPEDQVAALVQESAARFETYGHGLWALRPRGHDSTKATPLVGCGGFWPFHEPPRLELILSLGPAWHGQGLATETGQALLAYARDTLGMTEALASTDAPNAASQRLLDRLGFACTHRGDADGLDTLFYARAL